MATRPFAPTPFLVLLSAVLLPALVSGRADPPQDEAANPAPVVGEAPATPAGTPREVLSPMLQELMDYWDAQQQRLEDLHARTAAARDEEAFLSLQREIEAVLLETEVEMLSIQARHARREGRLDDALRIEAAVEEMTAPRPEVLPGERGGLRPRPR